MTMEEHDKWYKNYPPSTHLMPRFEFSRVVWKEALEWILRIKKQGDLLAQYEDDILMAIEGEIKRELGEDRTC